MTLSKSVHHYKDIAAHLHTILATDAQRRVFSSPARALRWRARAYMYRSLVRKADPDGSSLFDHLIFRITADKPNVITILREYDDGDAYFETADGQRIKPLLTPEDARMQEEARRMAREMGFPEPDFGQSETPKQLEQAVHETLYKSQVDAQLAELKAAMRRPAASQTPADPTDYEPPETPDISPQSLDDLGL